MPSTMHAAISDLILDIGTPAYGKSLFRLMRRQLAIRQMTVYRYVPDRPIQALVAESDGEELQLKRSLDRYIGHFHRRDPLNEVLAPGGHRDVLLRCVDADLIADEEFRDELYRRADIAGKLVLIVRRPGDTISVSFFRGREHGAFGEREQAFVGTWSRMLAATVERHFALTASPDARDIDELRGLCQALPATPALSQRELGVCARVLRGMTADGIAADLGVSYHSVVTYRRRAYVKLGIATQNQLFALALRREAR
jgi:DNA-binding CsgD family transcriptional regulator